jgi:hypothetical protein
VRLQMFLSITKTKKCQILSCDTPVANELYKHMSCVIPPSTPLVFGTKISTTRKSTSYGTMHVKNWQKTTGTKEKSDIISQLKKGEQIVDNAAMSKRLILAFVQFVIMLTKLHEVLRSGKKVIV